MSLPKKGKPIPRDLAREYLKTIADALRKESKSGRHAPGFLHSPTVGGGYRVPAFELAAAVLERVADGGKTFGDLIDGRGLSRHYEQAVSEVWQQTIDACIKGEPISREEAFRRADDALGWSDDRDGKSYSPSKRYFLEYQKHHGHVIELPFKGEEQIW